MQLGRVARLRGSGYTEYRPALVRYIPQATEPLRPRKYLSSTRPVPANPCPDEPSSHFDAATPRKLPIASVVLSRLACLLAPSLSVSSLLSSFVAAATDRPNVFRRSLSVDHGSRAANGKTPPVPILLHGSDIG
ncbi:uncharacterized protein LY79DRAFT_659078 [Colletotrichum navitas]|uniref:Uncharacterized protein n=1 Tax=Colletotrichum navitas TaxID=681940 RepID=A0AAD8Q078_9PEZI|nr:uncharacterized protein LY79DRAFT_659078 [Colletotrichum navitas]KAK1593378.1 hypothetical protein LY79DRAFT_659078 [Colletotrichum navitas]